MSRDFGPLLVVVGVLVVLVGVLASVVVSLLIFLIRR